MKINDARCPVCMKKWAMKPVEKFSGRDWPGSLCKNCGHFVPDVRSASYSLSCAGCKASIGRADFDYHYSDLDEATVRKILAAEAARAAREADFLDKMSQAAATVKAPAVRASIEKDIARRRESGLHEPRDLKLPQSWEKRHESARALHFCAKCHDARRAKKVDFAQVETKVRHEVPCKICSKTRGYLDLPEDTAPETQKDELRKQGIVCPGSCTEEDASRAANERALEAAVLAAALTKAEKSA
jgi:hypothetical protein